MSSPYDFLKPEEIAAITLLEKNGFECFVQARIGPARTLKTGARVHGIRGGKRFALALGLRSLEAREGETKLEEPEESEEAQGETTGEDAEGEKPISEMSRHELIDAVADIPGAGNPSRMKTDLLVEILTKYREGTFNPSDYE